MKHMRKTARHTRTDI